MLQNQRQRFRYYFCRTDTAQPQRASGRRCVQKYAGGAADEIRLCHRRYPAPWQRHRRRGSRCDLRWNGTRCRKRSHQLQICPECKRTAGQGRLPDSWMRPEQGQHQKESLLWKILWLLLWQLLRLRTGWRRRSTGRADAGCGFPN